MKVREYKIPADLRYTRGHEWARITNEQIEIGITDFGQKLLKRILSIEIPEINKQIVASTQFGTITRVQTDDDIDTMIDICAPVSGRVIRINETIKAHPDLINKDPYRAGWLLRVKPSNLEREWEVLLPANEYAIFVEEMSAILEELRTDFERYEIRWNKI